MRPTVQREGLLRIKPMPKSSPNNYKDTPEELRPRERLIRTGNSQELSNEDLLAIILKTGFPGCDVWELSHRLLLAFHSLHELVRADARTIEARIDEYNKKRPDHPILRVGPVKLLELQAAFELSRRANILLDAEFRSKNLKSSSAAYNVFAGIVAASPEQEHFYVLPTDSDFHPLCDPIAITKGTASRTIVHPRDVFREAIRWNAHSIIVAHNHPCGDPTPSDEDIEMTKQLIDIAKLHSIPLLDHLVLGSPRSADGKGYVSIRNLAVLRF